MHPFPLLTGLTLTGCMAVCLLGCAPGGQRLPTNDTPFAVSAADASNEMPYPAVGEQRTRGPADYQTLARRTGVPPITTVAWPAANNLPSGAAAVTPTAWPNGVSPPARQSVASNATLGEPLPAATSPSGLPAYQPTASSQPTGPIGAGVSIPWPSQAIPDRSAFAPPGTVYAAGPNNAPPGGVRLAAGADPIESAYALGEAMPLDLPAEPPLYTPLNPSIERLPPVYESEWPSQNMPALEELDGGANGSLAPQQSETGRWWLPYGLPQRAETAGQRLVDYLRQTQANVVSDYRHYYRWSTACDLGWAIALSAPLANTSLDEDFRHWYQRDVRSSGSDDLSSFWRPWGEGKIFIPAWAGLAVVGHLWEERPLATAVGRFGDRTTRAYLVGAPPMLLMQFALGASRPGETSHGSYWKPFDDTNAVSGHAFIGAVPFLTAARMTDRPAIKGALILLSTLPSWSRVNDDRHYLSQVCLGWYMAHLAVRAVDQTEDDRKPIRVVPIATTQMTGLGLVIER